MRFALAVADFSVPELTFGAFLDQTLEGALTDVPGHVDVIGLFGFADAFATVLVPDDVLAIGVGSFTVESLNALTGTVVERPEVVVFAPALDTDALSGKYIEFFIFVVTVPHLVSARAVIFDVVRVSSSPHELFIWANEEFSSDFVQAW